MEDVLTNAESLKLIADSINAWEIFAVISVIIYFFYKK